MSQRSAIMVVVITSKTTPHRSEEHTSELQSRLHLVCRLLLEKKKMRRAKMRRLERRWKPTSLRQEFVCRRVWPTDQSVRWLTRKGKRTPSLSLERGARFDF